jgi:hypothetical protein
MAIKLDSATNESVIAYHLIDGPHVFAYKIDAHHAVSNFPLEWSELPWTPEKAAAARSEMEARHNREVEEAKAKGLPVPKDLPPPPPPLDPEDEAALMEYNTAVAEASERLKAAREKAAKKKAEEDQIAADEALVASPPPQPDPTRRRPFGRTGEPTPAEAELMAKRAAAKKAADEKVAADKAAADAGIV